MQHGDNSLQSQLGTCGSEGHKAGLSLLAAALPLSDPKIKPKEISKNQ